MKLLIGLATVASIYSYPTLAQKKNISVKQLVQQDYSKMPAPIVNYEKADGLMDTSSRAKKISKLLAIQLEMNADLMQKEDLSQVMTLLRQASKIVRGHNDQIDQDILVDSDKVQVIKKNGGSWITLQYDNVIQPSRVSLKANGSGAIKIYSINFVTKSGQNVTIKGPQALMTSQQSVSVKADLNDLVSHIQILAEAVNSSSMELSVETYEKNQNYGDNNGFLPPPPPVGPVCELKGAGIYNYRQYNYLAGYENELKAGDDTLDGILNKMNQLSAAGLCSINVTQSCKVASAGIYNYRQYNYLVDVDGKIISGADSRENLFQIFDLLKKNKMCSTPNLERCDLEGPGIYNYRQYNARVSIGDKVVDGFDNQTEALKFIESLRSKKLCQ